MNPPDNLYKYQTLSAHSLASLANQTIWLAKPASFNDPFDCALTLDRAKYKESVMHAITVALERAEPQGLKHEHLRDIWPGDAEAFEEFRDRLRNLFQHAGICSFSSLPDHLLMWSHYASHHQGFCVEYDCREGTNLRKMARPVQYMDSVPSLSAADFAPPNNSSAIDAMWLTKAKCWSYEEEWRIINMERGNNLFQMPSKVESIIFGARMPESDRLMIVRTLRYDEDVKFKHAVLKEEQFAIEISSFDAAN